MKPSRRAVDPDESPGATAAATCSARSLRATVAALSVLVVVLASALGYVAYSKAGAHVQDDAPQGSSSSPMESSPSSSDVRNTRLLFSAGEESLSAKIDAAEASYAHVPEISAGTFSGHT